MYTAVKLRKPGPALMFLGLTISVGAIASWLAHGPHRQLPAVAASMDLTLTVPAAWYWLMVRPGLRSRATLAFVVLLGLWRASFLFPEVVPGKLWIGVGVESMLVAALVAGLRSARRHSAAFGDADPIDRLRLAIERQISPRAALGRDVRAGFAAKAIASEFSVFYYAFAWKAKPHAPSGYRAFYLHERSGANVLIGCLAVISLIEIVPVHLLFHRWSAAAAWTATGISVWGAVWMLALSRAFALRPTLVGPEDIVVRFGLLFRLVVPAEKILSIEPGAAAPEKTRIVPRGTPPSVYVRFTEPLEAELLAGFTRRLTAIALSADNDFAFRSALLSPDRGDVALLPKDAPGRIR